MFDFWRVYISLHFDAVRSFGPWGCWSNGACMAFFVSSGFAPPCGSGCWLCATCHIGVATTGSVRRFSLRCQLVSGWRWYCFHMTFSWSFHQTNLAWKGLLEHLDFYTRILQYFKSCCSWLICFFLLWKWSILKLLCRNAPLAQDSILPLIPVTFWLLLLCGFWSQSSHVLTEAILTASQGLQGLRSHCMEAPQEAEQLEQLEEAADDESDSRWSV